MNFIKRITDTNRETENTELELDFNKVLNQNSRLSTNFFDFAENSSVKQEYDIMNNVCICMIDIYMFSSWCSNQTPHIIATTMIEYNKLICNTIKKYKNIQRGKLNEIFAILKGSNSGSVFMYWFECRCH